MNLRGPLSAFLEAEEPSHAIATAALRFVYLVLFMVQVVVALGVGSAVSALVSARPPGNDAFAIILLLMAALHLPLAWVLAAAARRAGGKQAALSSTVMAAVLSSAPAWFAALMLISGQRPLYLFLVTALLSASYALGFLSTVGAASAATRRGATTRGATTHDATVRDVPA